jgi:hypothetical protein
MHCAMRGDRRALTTLVFRFMSAHIDIRLTAIKSSLSISLEPVKMTDATGMNASVKRHAFSQGKQ